MIRILIVLLLLASCSQEQQLKATLVTPTDVELAWRPVPDVEAQVVEYANEEAGPYTILQFVPSGQTAYRHPELIPETNFYYRVRGIIGQASDSVDVTLPPGDEVSETDSHDWAQPVVRKGGTLPVSSAKPADLRAEVRHANGILFTWNDIASDEEGYLLELKPNGAADYRVAAQLDQDVVSFGLVTLPDEKRATYRVRPFRFGPPTNLVHQKTGK